MRIEQAVMARSYYWHASLLLNDDIRPELSKYVRSNYKRLTEWLERNRVSFDHYGKTGIWVEPTCGTHHLTDKLFTRFIKIK
jgi:hypothetical protein